MAQGFLHDQAAVWPVARLLLVLLPGGEGEVVEADLPGRASGAGEVAEVVAALCTESLFKLKPEICYVVRLNISRATEVGLAPLNAKLGLAGVSEQEEMLDKVDNNDSQVG